MLRSFIVVACSLWAASCLGQSAPNLASGAADIADIADIACNSDSEEVVLHAQSTIPSPVVDVLWCGSRVTILEKQTGWYRVRAQGGKEGYVKEAFIKPQAKTQPATSNQPAWVKCFGGFHSLSLWPQPNGLGKSLVEVPCGDKVVLLEEGEWDKLQVSGGQIGFINSAFISITRPLPLHTQSNTRSQIEGDDEARAGVLPSQSPAPQPVIQPATAQTADVLEAQYKTCAKHYIPSDKCTPEIYQQLKAKDEAPLNSDTSFALWATKLYQGKLRNPDSMQVRAAYVVRGKSGSKVCLEIGAQNGLGGITVSQVVYASGVRGSGWNYPTTIGGVEYSAWQADCTKSSTDVTESVNQALKNGR